MEQTGSHVVSAILHKDNDLFLYKKPPFFYLCILLDLTAWRPCCYLFSFPD